MPKSIEICLKFYIVSPFLPHSLILDRLWNSKSQTGGKSRIVKKKLKNAYK